MKNSNLLPSFLNTTTLEEAEKFLSNFAPNEYHTDVLMHDEACKHIASLIYKLRKNQQVLLDKLSKTDDHDETNGEQLFLAKTQKKEELYLTIKKWYMIVVKARGAGDIVVTPIMDTWSTLLMDWLLNHTLSDKELSELYRNINHAEIKNMIASIYCQNLNKNK